MKRGSPHAGVLVRLLVPALVVGAALACGPADDAPADPPAGATAGGDREQLREFWDTYRAATAARTAGDATTAIPLYRKVLETDPEHGDSLHFLAQLLYAAGDVGGARELLVRLTESDPRSPRGWQQLSVLQGSPAAGWVAAPDNALESIRKAVEWNPSNSGAQALRARWAAHAGRLPEARAALAAALDLNPSNAEALAVQGWLQGATGAASSPGAGRLRAAAAPPPAAEHGLRAELDLDDDGTVDLRVTAPRVGDPATLIAIAAGAELEVPADVVVDGWDGASRDGLRPTAWRATFLTAPRGVRLVLLGGGADPLRVYASSSASRRWHRAGAAGLPGEVHGSVLAAADLNGDGLTDLLLGNLPGSGGEAPGLWTADDGGGFARDPTTLPANATAALLADVDGDGFTDLLVASARAASPIAGAKGDAGPPDCPVLLLLGGEHGLRAAPGRVPSCDAAIVDLAAVPGSGVTEVYVATGGLTPGSSTADLLWRWSGDRFIDASEELGDLRFGATFRILPTGGQGGYGLLRLLRGGLVRGDPRSELLLGAR